MPEELTLCTNDKTPIEIALQIDDEGRTTARKLYEFLELDKRNYSRWCKSNITDNKFAEENLDYWVFVIHEENIKGGRPTRDYKLTASFAKKLAMVSGGERGDQAREYFLKTEEALKQVAVRNDNDIERLKSQMFDLISMNKSLEKRLSELELRQHEVIDQNAIPFISKDDMKSLVQLSDMLTKLRSTDISEKTENTKNGSRNSNNLKNANTLDLPLTNQQLSNIRAEITDCVRIQQEKIGAWCRGNLSANQIIRGDIYKAIKSEIGVRHTLARQSQYQAILHVIKHYSVSESIVRRIDVFKRYHDI